MNKSRARAIKKFVIAAYPKNQVLRIAKYKELKNAKKTAYLVQNIPKSPLPFSIKLHKGESLMDFARRRKAANNRRREREAA